MIILLQVYNLWFISLKFNSGCNFSWYWLEKSFFIVHRMLLMSQKDNIYNINNVSLRHYDWATYMYKEKHFRLLSLHNHVTKISWFWFIDMYVAAPTSIPRKAFRNHHQLTIIMLFKTKWGTRTKGNQWRKKWRITSTAWM